MAIQLSVAVREARLNAIETTIGAAPTLEIRTTAQPANCAAADTGSALAILTLPSDWMAAAGTPGAGQKGILGGPWQDTSADAGGTAAHFRIKQGATCHMQGSIGQGSGDLSLDNTTIVLGQTVSITAFTLTDANS